VAQPVILLPPSEGKAPGGRGSWDPSAGAFGGLEAERSTVARSLDPALLDGAVVLPAWRRFTGVVWQHLDPATLAPAARRRVVVVSALMGLVRGDDPVPDHRLKLSLSLPPLGRLDRWWRPVLTAALRDHVRRRARSAAGPTPGAADGRGAAGHAAKAVKGVAARTLLEAGDLDGFEWQGWRAERVDPATVAVRAPS
jgi:uncharacterized protein